MRIFRRRDDEPADMNERSPQLGLKYKDLAVLGQLMKSGADLSQSSVRRLGGEPLTTRP